MQVYPAAGLVNYMSENAQLIVINPEDSDFHFGGSTVFIKEKAVKGMQLLKPILIDKK